MTLVLRVGAPPSCAPGIHLNVRDFRVWTFCDKTNREKFVNAIHVLMSQRREKVSILLFSIPSLCLQVSIKWGLSESLHARLSIGLGSRPDSGRGPGACIGVTTSTQWWTELTPGHNNQTPRTSALALTLTGREKDDILNTIISWCDWRVRIDKMQWNVLQNIKVG